MTKVIIAFFICTRNNLYYSCLHCFKVNSVNSVRKNVFIHSSSITDREIKYFRKLLVGWFTTHKREFPWRVEEISAYSLIIAEALLQRTKAENASRYFENFLKTFPTWESIVESPIETLERHIQHLGLYRQKSRRLKSLALEMVKRQGVFPQKIELLEQLPFMGQYMVYAVQLILHNKHLPLLDVNMARVLERYFGKRKMADIRFDPYLQELSRRVVNNKDSKILSWAILDFAALVCKSRKPLCNTCILNKNCLYFNELIQ